MSSIAVLLSGGVDSAVALQQLVAQRGPTHITACYLKIWLEDELSFLGECPWEEDLKYVKATCKSLGVPLEIINLQSEYLERVVDHALDELRAGRTPSPDIHCNERIKFGAFLEKVDSQFDDIASGHYAQVKLDEHGKAHLHQAPDPIKDQTYFLSNLRQDQLQHIIFPIGHLAKAEVRRLAEQHELPPMHRKDSQGICFLGKIPYREFVKFHLGEKEGKIIELESEKTLGLHKGSWFHTIGQRKGLGLGQGPWFVVDKNFEDNIVFVSHQERFSESARQHFELRDINWIQTRPDKELKLELKLRHGPNKTWASLKKVSERSWQVELEQSDTGIASGQHAVLYQESECLGGGVIHLP